MNPCQCQENCQCKNKNDIRDFLDRLFHNEPVKDTCYERIVNKGGFKNIQELEDAREDILIEMSDDIPAADLNKMIKHLKRNQWQTIRLFIFYAASVIYIGCCFFLLAFNALLVKNDINNQTNDDQIRQFHVTEFTCPLLYMLFVFFATFKVPVFKKYNVSYVAGWVILVTSLFEIMTSVIAALLVYLDVDEMEYVAHFLEYTTFLLLTIVDIAIVLVSKDKWYLRILSVLLSLISQMGVIAMIVMMYYGLELMTHFLEFTIEIILVVGTIITVSIQKQ